TQIVGVGGAPCDYGDLQAALDHAYSLASGNPGDPVEVWLTRYNITYYDLSVTLDVPANADITVRGGFSGCFGTYDGVHTPVDGHKGYSANPGPVFPVYGGRGGTATFREVDIGSGTADYGGGIFFNTGGVLRIYDSRIDNNHANYHGGGLYAGNNAYVSI